jgi:hypothetical protein
MRNNGSSTIVSHRTSGLEKPQEENLTPAAPGATDAGSGIAGAKKMIGQGIYQFVGNALHCDDSGNR